MNDLKYIKDYKDNEKYRLSFNELAINTFGIDFEPWFQKGFWNDSYICYSYIDGNKIVSNISINKMDIIWEGQKKKALQIGTVMTHPDYRKKGLASSLMRTILDEYEKEYDIIYLFGGDSALSLYYKFGFKPLEESKFSLAVSNSEASECKLRKLDISNKEDLMIISRLSSNRTYISEKLGVTNDQHLILFYCLYVFLDNIYYLEEEDTIVIYSIDDNELNLYDVVSKKSINLESIILKITTPKVNRVVFHFTPCLKSIKVDVEDLHRCDCTLLIKPVSMKSNNKFLFPITSHA